MDWQNTVFEVIDMRSFSNLWFYIALAVMWSSASHWVLGVPFDMVTRARRHGDTVMADLQDLTRINVNRLLYISDVSGSVSVLGGSFFLTVIAVLGFYYQIEFAQAIFLLMFPMSFVFALSVRKARRIRDEAITGEALCTALNRHRIAIQAIGMVSILVTGMWGMYQNLSHGLLLN